MSLLPLSRWPEHEFAEGTYDVRGWTVRTRADGEKAGTVHDLLLDTDGTPRYLDVDLGLFRKHVLLPLANARADREQRLVWVPGFTREQLREIPAYEHDIGEVDPERAVELTRPFRSADRTDGRGRDEAGAPRAEGDPRPGSEAVRADGAPGRTREDAWTQARLFFGSEEH